MEGMLAPVTNAAPTGIETRTQVGPSRDTIWGPLFAFAVNDHM